MRNLNFLRCKFEERRGRAGGFVVALSLFNSTAFGIGLAVSFLSFSAPWAFSLGGSGGIARSLGLVDSCVRSFEDPPSGGLILLPAQI